MQTNKIEVTFYKSLTTGGFLEQLTSILEQLIKFPQHKIPVKLSFFTTASDHATYDLEFNIIQQKLIEFQVLAPFALIAQFPFENKCLTLEFVTIDNADINVEIAHNNNSLLLKYIDQELLFATVNSYQGKTFQENVDLAFQILNGILDNFKFTYSDVIRQWNYMEDILYKTYEKGSVKQNYQIFNDLRSLQYSTSNFSSGYPVATGIGTTTGGCSIEIIALKSDNVDLIPVHNIRQIDAHSYTENVLIGNHAIEREPASTPKFERAKIVKNSALQMLLVSGTASIIGEKTVCVGDIACQTQVTIDNINILLNIALSKTNCQDYSLLNYRVYLKNSTDIAIVKQICDQNYDSRVGIILKSDICRDDLLIEIECNYMIKF